MSDTPRTDNAVRFAISRGMTLAPLADFARELERENAALRTEVNVTRKNYEEYKAENIALRADKERLDYMEKNVDFVSWMFHGKPHSWDFRGKIDAKRKEAQP